jgi:hypothetical protein
MKIIIAIALVSFLVLFVGCGDNTPAENCDIPATSNVGSQDCGGVTSDGHRCVTLCGELPQDGSPGHLLAIGCLIPQAETPALAVCVASCSECQ